MKLALGVVLFLVGVLLFCWFLNSFAPGEPKDGIQDHEASKHETEPPARARAGAARTATSF